MYFPHSFLSSSMRVPVSFAPWSLIKMVVKSSIVEAKIFLLSSRSDPSLDWFCSRNAYVMELVTCSSCVPTLATEKMSPRECRSCMYVYLSCPFCPEQYIQTKETKWQVRNLNARCGNVSSRVEVRMVPVCVGDDAICFVICRGGMSCGSSCWYVCHDVCCSSVSSNIHRRYHVEMPRIVLFFEILGLSEISLGLTAAGRIGVPFAPRKSFSFSINFPIMT